MAVIAKKHSYYVTNSLNDTDIVVVNSCTVTANSDRKVLSYIRKIRRENPLACIVLCGCLPQANQQQELYGADIVIGNTNKYRYIEYIEQFARDKNQIVNIEIFHDTEYVENIPVPRMRNHTRAFLKIEDGCDRYCSYCVVPFARGNIRSLPIEDIHKQALLYAENNYKEIVLTGINLSSYGKDTSYTLADAVAAVDVDGIERIRLSSLEPDLMTDDLIGNLSENKKLCAHFHLSLQSGSNSVLKAMNRRYTTEDYLRVTEKLKITFPSPTFTTDIMVGFPTESDNDFIESLEFISNMKFLKCHVFTYSPRAKTKAATLQQIPEKIKKERMRKMVEVSSVIRNKILIDQIGTSSRIIVEGFHTDRYFEGYTDRYIPVMIKDNLTTGDIVEVDILSVDRDRCIAVLSGR